MSIGLLGLPGTPLRTRGSEIALPQGFLVSDKRRLITSMTTQNPDSMITVKNSLIAQSNSLFNAKNSLFGFLGNFLVSHCSSLPIFYCFPAWQGLTMKISCIFPANREFGFRDGFARDCLLQQRVFCEPDFSIIASPGSRDCPR